MVRRELLWPNMSHEPIDLCSSDDESSNADVIASSIVAKMESGVVMKKDIDAAQSSDIKSNSCNSSNSGSSSGIPSASHWSIKRDAIEEKANKCGVADKKCEKNSCDVDDVARSRSNLGSESIGCSDCDDDIICISSTEEDAGNRQQQNVILGSSQKPSNCRGNNNNCKVPHRKRKAPSRLVDDIQIKAPQLACERECKFTLSDRKEGIIAKKSRDTCCTHIEPTAKPNRKRKLPKKVLDALDMALQEINKGSDEKEPSSMYEGKWKEEWRCTDELKQPPTNTKNHAEGSQGGQSVPVSLVSFDTSIEDDSSELTIDLYKPDEVDLTIEDSDDSMSECEHERPKFATPKQKCRCMHHHTQINILLDEFKAGNRLDVNFCIQFVKKVKDVLRCIEDDGCNGRSIFFHTACELNESPNPILTVVRLLQLFDAVCHIAMTQYSDENTKCSSLLQLLFRPWRKSSQKDCGVVIQMLYIATSEILNSREDYVPPESPDDLDQLIGVTLGLQLLQTMARNVYTDCAATQNNTKSISFPFLDKPLESYETCFRWNCKVVGKKVKVVCIICGVRYHKKCVRSADNVVDDALEKCCPLCCNAAYLLDAARANKLVDIYSLLVEKGASPLQPLSSKATSYETTPLHNAIQSNNYDLASMFLYGAYILLKHCDDRVWNFPKVAWPKIASGRENKLLTPFESGIESIITNMSVRPPVEILLLMCARGTHERPDDIHKALGTRQRMMMAMKGVDSKDALMKTDITAGLEPVAIPVNSNNIPSFTAYIARCIETRTTAIRWMDCRYGGGASKQLALFRGQCNSESLKRLHHQQGARPSWKSYCNYLCSAEQTGPNRLKCKCQIAEEGVHHGIEVFETAEQGFGIRTRKGVIIKKHEIICHYAGEIIPSDEAKRRDDEYAKNAHQGSYIFDLDEAGNYCIDATNYRSMAALINHSCSEPTCEL